MVTYKKRSLITLLGAYLMVCGAIAGCADTKPLQPSKITAPTPASSTDSMPGLQQWATILKGESVQELTFTSDGTLLYEDKVLLSEIPVSYTSNGDVTYAERLIISDSSPSGRFNVVKACEGTTEGLCWSLFLVDRQSKMAEKIDIAKYGGQNWVQWSTDERYAVFAESMEGVSRFVVLDLQTRESKMFEQTAATADLSSFKWTSDRTFEANIVCANQPNCDESPFRGDISTVFAE